MDGKKSWHRPHNRLWNADFTAALEQCRAVIGKLTHADLRGYRALWLYLAGSAAWLANQSGQLPNDDIAKDYFRQAQAAAPVLRWLVGLHANRTTATVTATSADSRLATMIERIELILEKMGTIHDRKYDAEESAILSTILNPADGTAFEDGHERLGRLLGYSAGNSTEEAAPDPWWIADDTLCFVFEDHADGSADTIFSVRKARQAVSHPDWIRNKLALSSDVEIIPVLITPCTRTTKGAIPSLKKVHYWHLDNFRSWAKNALQVVREIRREFPGPGNLAWRTATAEKLKRANIGPEQLKQLLSQTGADAMHEVAAEEEI